MWDFKISMRLLDYNEAKARTHGRRVYGIDPVLQGQLDDLLREFRGEVFLIGIRRALTIH